MLDTIPIRPAIEPLLIGAALLAKRLNVSLRTIRTWDAAGKIPTPLRISGTVKFSVAEVEAWIAAGAPCRTEWVARTASRQK